MAGLGLRRAVTEPLESFMTGLQIFIVRRLVLNAFVLFCILTIVFTLFRLLPASPEDLFADQSLPREYVVELRRQWGLDDPLWKQYLQYLANMFTFQFGYSFLTRLPVAEVLFEKLLNTFAMLFPAVVIATILGTILGATAGWRRGAFVEQVTVATCLFLRSTPSYFVGLLFLMVFSYKLGWFPSGGMITPGVAINFLDIVSSADFYHHLILPMLVVITREITGPIMILRSSMLEVKGSDFLDILRAKGLPESTIVVHATRNALLPLITDVAIMTGELFQGQVLIETIFAWPGIGREIVASVNNLDYPMAQAAFFLIALSVLTMNFIADLLYAVADPRVRPK
jgi:peptide/nickel transport system permease protein